MWECRPSPSNSHTLRRLIRSCIPPLSILSFPHTLATRNSSLSLPLYARTGRWDEQRSRWWLRRSGHDGAQPCCPESAPDTSRQKPLLRLSYILSRFSLFHGRALSLECSSFLLPSRCSLSQHKLRGCRDAGCVGAGGIAAMTALVLIKSKDQNMH